MAEGRRATEKNGKEKKSPEQEASEKSTSSRKSLFLFLSSFPFRNLNSGFFSDDKFSSRGNPFLSPRFTYRGAKKPSAAAAISPHNGPTFARGIKFPNYYAISYIPIFFAGFKSTRFFIKKKNVFFHRRIPPLFSGPSYKRSTLHWPGPSAVLSTSECTQRDGGGGGVTLAIYRQWPQGGFCVVRIGRERRRENQLPFSLSRRERETRQSRWTISPLPSFPPPLTIGHNQMADYWTKRPEEEKSHSGRRAIDTHRRRERKV